MILDNAPGKSDDYPVGLFQLSESDELPTKMITAPMPIKTDDNLSYIFIINGLVINYKIAGDSEKNFYDVIKIKENNTLDVYLFDKNDSKQFLDSYLKTK